MENKIIVRYTKEMAENENRIKTRESQGNAVTPQLPISPPVPLITDRPKNKTRVTSFANFVLAKASKFEQETALIDSSIGRSYTYGEVINKFNRLRRALKKRGFKRGDVIAIYSFNSIDYPIVVLSVASFGGIVTLANAMFTVEELTRQLKDSNARCLFAADEVIAKALSAARQCSSITDVFTFGKVDGLASLSSLYEEDADVGQGQGETVDLTNDVLTLLCSSGTMGLPKCVMTTQRNWLTSIGSLSLRKHGFTSSTGSRGSTVLLFAPFSHTLGYLWLMISLRRNCTCIVMPKFNLQEMCRNIQVHKVKMLPAVVPVINMLAEDPSVSQYDLSSLELVYAGAGYLRPELIEKFKQRLGITVLADYGMTEASGPISFVRQSCYKLGTIGRISPWLDAKVVDAETGTRQLAAGEDGELCVRGGSVMRGYLNNDKATHETIDSDGWLHTGDLGNIDSEGYLTLTGRLKELIKYNGFQIAPMELETLLLEHPAVKDAAVIGVPDKLAGELPRAFIVKKPSTHVTEADIINFVQGHVAPYKQLRGGVMFISEIPRLGISGKILRRKLLADYVVKPVSKL